ncbi:LysR family transcriptional regulator [Desulfosporosinus sp. PR]|uniref:LysR family transcriptional regulator n=1 Tax=Candidatus Desulfosporosinus nitrosoreducens TaxID=3401928 RepID=UPI0027F2A29F|nr:LysR family transcriptional regulator [Desulfosporosinus sp. PR]MDQ7095074.1 LysR family transcriptional regulator [Desulfosporosinus sp. PR]
MEEQLLIFKKVAETKNISLAAKRLHMSQPSISLQIQNLESQYGARFLERTNKGVSLTQAGQVFYEHICQVLEIFQNMQETILTLRDEEHGLVNLGATLTIGEYVLPPILTYLNQLHPDIDFRVKIANTEVISQEVLEKRLHIGLIEGPVYLHKELQIESFWEDELVVVIPYHHPWAKKDNITLAELPNELMIAREVGSGTRKVIELALSERGFDPDNLNITMELGSTHAIKQVVAAGLGMTIISALTVCQECEHQIFKKLTIQESPIKRSLNILTHAQTAQTKNERLIIDLLHNHELLAKVLSIDNLAYV